MVCHVQNMEMRGKCTCPPDSYPTMKSGQGYASGHGYEVGSSLHAVHVVFRQVLSENKSLQ